jgi:hypothetical protein
MANFAAMFRGAIFLLLGLMGSMPTMAQKTDGGKALPAPKLGQNGLFYLQRNKNTNTVVYDARLRKDGTIDPEEPIDAYWLGFEENGGKREDLSFFENMSVYGVDAEAIKGRKDEYVLRLKAFKERSVTLARDKVGHVVGKMKIAGKEARLTRIYIQAKEGGLRPDVLHIDLFGEDLITGEKLYERLKP